MSPFCAARYCPLSPTPTAVPPVQSFRDASVSSPEREVASPQQVDTMVTVCVCVRTDGLMMYLQTVWRRKSITAGPGKHGDKRRTEVRGDPGGASEPTLDPDPDPRGRTQTSPTRPLREDASGAPGPSQLPAFEFSSLGRVPRSAPHPTKLLILVIS